MLNQILGDYITVIKVAVIGTVFVDCKGFARESYNAAGRNLGSIQFIHGGVGRNVAENMANLGIPTTFLSSVDRTGLGKEVVEKLIQTGVDTQYILEQDQTGMGMWMAILDEKGDLAGSISQMPSLDELEAFLAHHGNALSQDVTHIILELDLNAAITKSVIDLARTRNIPVYGIPGNLSVILAHREVLADVDCFVCNEIEVSRLLDVPFHTLELTQMYKRLEYFVCESGLASMVVTLGSKGAVYFDRLQGISGYQPVFPVEVVDSSGAGDAFFSGTIAGLISGEPLAQAVQYGSRIAAWTIQCTENTCSNLMAKMHTDKLFDDYLVWQREIGRGKSSGKKVS